MTDIERVGLGAMAVLIAALLLAGAGIGGGVAMTAYWLEDKVPTCDRIVIDATRRCYADCRQIIEGNAE